MAASHCVARYQAIVSGRLLLSDKRHCQIQMRKCSQTGMYRRRAGWTGRWSGWVIRLSMPSCGITQVKTIVDGVILPFFADLSEEWKGHTI